MAAEDVTLTFDSKPFMSAINQVSQSMTASMGKFSAWTVAKGQLLAGVVKSSVMKVAGYMPEISRAFSMAGDVITRNLFWPLRKEIVPMLQKMLDWVRDHRAMFVQWGNVLVNIFRTIKTIIVGFIDLLKHMWERLSAGLERIFGKTTNTVSQTINLILFKLTVVFSFVKSLMEPFIDFMVDGFLKIIEYVKAFSSGFMEGLANIGATLGEAMRSFKGLYDVVHNLLGDGNALVTVFKLLGNVIGGAVRWAIVGLSTVLDGLAERIERFTNLINMLKIYKDTGNLDFATKMGEIGEKTITAKYAVRTKQRGQTMSEGDAQTWEAMKKNFSGENKNPVVNPAVNEKNKNPVVKPAVNEKNKNQVVKPAVIKPASNNVNTANSKVDNSTTNINVSGSKDPAKDAVDIHKNLKKAKTLQGN